MRYEVRITKKAVKQVAKLSPPRQQQRVADAIDALAQNPRDGDTLPLKGRYIPQWRLRVGDYRIFYEFTDDPAVVQVNQVRHRQSAY